MIRQPRIGRLASGVDHMCRQQAQRLDSEWRVGVLAREPQRQRIAFEALRPETDGLKKVCHANVGCQATSVSEHSGRSRKLLNLLERKGLEAVL